MKIEEVKNLVSEIVKNKDNQALVTDSLEKIVSAYSENYTVKETLVTEKEKYEQKIKELQDVNMKFFTQLQTQGQQQEQTKQDTPQDLNLAEIFKI